MTERKDGVVLKRSQTIFKRGDLLLFFSIAAIACTLLALTLLPRAQGGSVIVKSNGRTQAEYPLSQDRTVELHSESGGHNVLVIEDGCAYITEASCPDKLCIHSGRISETGQTLICLPNRLSIIISD